MEVNMPLDDKERHPMQRLTLTVLETSRLIGVSRGTAYEAVRSGAIPSIRIGRRILVPKDALEQWLKGAPRSKLDSN